ILPKGCKKLFQNEISEFWPADLLKKSFREPPPQAPIRCHQRLALLQIPSPRSSLFFYPTYISTSVKIATSNSPVHALSIWEDCKKRAVTANIPSNTPCLMEEW